MRRLLSALATVILGGLLLGCAADNKTSLQDYVLFATDQLQGLVTDMSAVSGLTEYQRPLDPTWQAETRKAAAALKSRGEKLQSYSRVPEEAAALNRSVTAVGKDLVFMADEITAYVENPRAGHMGTAAARKPVLNSDLRAVKAELEKLDSSLKPALVVPQ